MVRKTERPNKPPNFRSHYLWAFGVLAVIGGVAWFAMTRPASLPDPGLVPDPMAQTPTDLTRPNDGHFISIGAVAVSEVQADVGELPVNKAFAYGFKILNISDEPVKLGPVQVNMLQGC